MSGVTSCSVLRRECRVNTRSSPSTSRSIWFEDGLSKRLLAEAPTAYNPTAAVMLTQKEPTRIERRLRPC